MRKPLPAAFLNFPIVDPKTGRASIDVLRFLNNLIGQSANLNLDGSINGGAGGDIDPAVLAGQVANLDANGIVLPNGIDMSRAYINKFLDFINDGTTFYRPVIANTLSPDLPYNGDFEIFPDTASIAQGWTAAFEVLGAGDTKARSTSPYQGTYAQQMINSAANGEAIASRPLAVLAGHWYRFRVRAKSTVANPGTMYLRVLWYSNNDDLSRFSASLISNVDIVAASGPTAANTYQLFEGTVQAPTGAKFCRVALYNWIGTVNTMTFDTCTVGSDVTDTPGINTGAVNNNGEFSNDTAQSLTTSEAVYGTVSISTNGGNVEIYAKCNIVNSSGATEAVQAILRKDSLTGVALDSSTVTVTATVNKSTLYLCAIDATPSANQSYVLTAFCGTLPTTISNIRIIAANRKR